MAEFTFSPLTPSAFLARTARTFADRVAIVDGDRTFTYREFADRCGRVRGALTALGVRPGDRVAALCTNSHVLLELHQAVPASGAVLVALNIRLSADELGYIVQHSGAEIIVATVELAATAAGVAAATGARVVVAGGTEDEWEALLDTAPRPAVVEIDERSLLAINYTSGTTGRPRGVMYHHRGAYLQAVAMAYHARLGPDSRYLWTLPMFHCNGWCFTWAVTAAGGTHVCLRSVDAEQIWRLLREQRITHFSAAPTVLTIIAESPAAAGPALEQNVHVDVGGAPPSPTLLERLAALRMDITHLYGLTETFGPIAINEWQEQWDALSGPERASLRARQGISNIIATPLRVLDGDGGDVPADGETIGELAARGNDVMLGYYRDEDATRRVTVDGWFLTGDLAVMHPDGYVEIRDRRKDIIISGGENIASVEVERALDTHPGVLECAVVGAPDPRWGEVPVAFVVLREGHAVSADDLIAHARESLAGFKVPRQYHFGELPKTSTGKIQKNVLRTRVN